MKLSIIAAVLASVVFVAATQADNWVAAAKMTSMERRQIYDCGPCVDGKEQCCGYYSACESFNCDA